MIYDTHCHPILSKEKWTSYVIDAFFRVNPDGYLNMVWTNLDDSKKILEISKSYENIFCTIWIHPTDTIKYKSDLADCMYKLEKLYIDNKDKIVAIWECGLDYHWINALVLEYDLTENEIVKIQKNFFISQIELAKRYNLPIIIHNRNSKEDIFKILKKTNFKNFIFHCYTEDLEYANKLIEFAPNCKISFSWIVTFNNAKDIQETAKNINLKNILIETDSPFLTPSPYRWKQENEPYFVKYVLEKIIELRIESKNTIEKQIFKNSLETFF